MKNSKTWFILILKTSLYKAEVWGEAIFFVCNLFFCILSPHHNSFR